VALDFCIRNNHDEIILLIPISLSLYDDIMAKVETDSRFELIPQKMDDYWSDSEIYILELPKLKNELLILQTEMEAKHGESLYLLVKACEIAINLNKTISVIAD
jgi:hypothetical protein